MYASSNGVFKHAMELSRGQKPHMFLREYVQNGIDAHKRIDSENKKVLVDFDHLYYKEHGVFKLSFTDNAIGMDKVECRNYLLKMFDTTGEENKNFGIGAKISGAKRNKAIQVKTIKKNQPGYYFLLNISDDGFTLERFDGEECVKIGIEDFPKIIQESGHGTSITFLGLDLDDDTMAPWSETSFPRGEWLGSILNDTFFRLPENITLNCRVNYHKNVSLLSFDDSNNHYKHSGQNEGGENRLSYLKGTQIEYQNASQKRGVVYLSDNTKIHWYILKEGLNHGFYLRRRKSRIAFVCDNENYNARYGARADFPNWNIHYCSDRIALFIEVDSKFYEPDHLRKHLRKTGSSMHDKANGSDMPVAQWQQEWKRKFPEEIVQEEDSASENTNTQELDLNILKNLPFIKDDVGRINPDGFDVQDDIEDALTRAIRVSEKEKERTEIKKRGQAFGDLKDNIRRKSEKSSKSKAVSAEPNFMPQNVKQVSAEDEDHELFGWSCKYDEGKDELIINSKYKGLSACISMYMPKINNVHQAKKIKDFIINAYIDRLKLAVCQAKMIKGTLKVEDFELMTSKQSLTMVVSPNVREDSYLRKEIKKFTA